MDKKIEKKVNQAIEEILNALEIDGTFNLEEIEGGYNVVVSTEDSGIVIGHHGDTLEALQIILSQAVSKKVGEFKRVSVEVGDYKKNREEYLRSLAQQTKERVLEEKKEVFLPELKSWERRIVHVFLQDDPDVVSESIGEGKDRTLVIKPK